MSSLLKSLRKLYSRTSSPNRTVPEKAPTGSEKLRLTSSQCDVLIIGAGPSGLMLALWLARMGVSARIVDKRTDKIYSGQADGFHARTLEILDSFGVGERVWKEGYRIQEFCFWNPDANGTLQRVQRGPDLIQGISRFSESILHQGRLEMFLTDAIAISAQTPSEAIAVEHCVVPTQLTIDESAVSDPAAYPSGMLKDLGRKKVQALGEDIMVGPREEVVRAKYVVGCDGAHSWTRKTLGDDYKMVGESTDHIWGVIDIVPITDFPDIRNRCVIYSKSDGNMMVIPRENRLVRLYIQLNKVSTCTNDNGRLDRSGISPKDIISAAKKIMAPYKLEYHYYDWWAAYQIGQRVGNHFSKLDRVFLAGDAVHTHSPKAGQGMNVSMQDTYNLGWKLGLVCRNLAPRSILSTYDAERRANAQSLIDFDQKFSKLFTEKPPVDAAGEIGVSLAELERMFKEGYMFTSGIGIKYAPSTITQAAPKGIATKCIPGSRIPSVTIHNQWDARPWDLHHRMPSDGRFRIFVFSGCITSSDSAALERTNALGGFIQDTLQAKYGRLTLSAAPDVHTNGGRFAGDTAQVSVLDVILVHSGDRAVLQPLQDVHEVYRPFDEKLGWDYEHVFVDDVNILNGVHSRAYENLGIGESGAVVVVRPDGYIGLVTDLEERSYVTLEGYFDRILIH
ncbi:hypothetical protein TD95_000906 [Thielaviopsis punctulata]|uniref:FAD-binding domain-containing protein n=1 Tax=Thielaviopsis punctulata TaxID=72032 RepID=A0A0F4ZFS5_9PEZI|nr:hypothetical protein TD95_000906 [Thielaviopsis punctulata]